MARRPSPGSLRRLGEFAFIERVARRAGPAGARLVQGIGDDTAIIVPEPRRHLLLTVDLLIETVHFTHRTATLEQVGFKAAVSNFSDIAAMGGTPRYALVALAAPASTGVTALDALYRGLLQACRRYDVQLVGGDTSASPRHLFLAVTVAGTASPRTVLTRAGARVGDHLYVTGTLGDSQAGLRLALAGARTGRGRQPAAAARHARFLLRRHSRPSARVREGTLVARHRLASAAIDLSDGLSGDLRHLCASSGVGAELEATSLPISPACRWYADRTGIDATRLALVGGEDYELLMTVAPRHRSQLERLARARHLRLTRIGTIRPRRFGIKLRLPSGRLRNLPAASYEHFRGGGA